MLSEVGVGESGEEGGNYHRFAVFRGEVVIRFRRKALYAGAKLGKIFIGILANAGEREEGSAGEVRGA